MDLGSPTTPRWVQRFANFDRAIVLLREIVDLCEQPGSHPAFKEAAIQRFEFTWELAWKTLKDYLVDRRVTLERLTAADVIRTAFASGFIDEGQDWMDALDARNRMSHTYDLREFERVYFDIRDRYLPRFEALHEMFITERLRIDMGRNG